MSSEFQSSQSALLAPVIVGALGVTVAVALLIHSPWTALLARRLAGQSHAESISLEGPASTLTGVAAPVAASQPVRYEPLTPDQAQRINAATPTDGGRLTPMPPMVLSAYAGDRDVAAATGCLAQAVYFEAGGESLTGQAAVAQVVLNRLRHPLFPKTVCDVVFQGANLRTGCQFTFTCDGSLGRMIDPRRWATAHAVAERALSGYVERDVGTATHYHTQWVVPYWKPSLAKLGQIGAHIFYRWPGSLGSASAFRGRYAGNEPMKLARGDASPAAPSLQAAASAAQKVQVQVPPAVLSVTPLLEPVRALDVVATPLKVDLTPSPEPRRTETAVSTVNPRLAVPREW